MRISYVAPYRGRVACDVRLFVWLKRRYPEVLESGTSVTETEIVWFVHERDPEFAARLIKTHRFDRHAAPPTRPPLTLLDGGRSSEETP